MPSYRSSASGETASGTSHAVTAPTGIEDGDLLLVSIANATSSTLGSSTTPPAGWTLLQDGGGTSQTYWKVASGEGSSWTFTTGVAALKSWISVAVVGHNRSTPVSDFTYVSDAGATTTTAPTVTPTTSSDLLICFFVSRGSGYTMSTPAGMTEFADVSATNNYTGHSGCYELLTSSAATGTRSTTYSVSATPRIGYSVLATMPSRSGLFFGINH